ncbi:MAG: hypothetical protein DMD82_15415 [Candidatus Rokuibacteriota bacterium]|nr:MAG: hypothetical protein DMD82_15415 [Candidatus Rokubacteria bacterium]
MRFSTAVPAPLGSLAGSASGGMWLIEAQSSASNTVSGAADRHVGPSGSRHSRSEQPQAACDVARVSTPIQSPCALRTVAEVIAPRSFQRSAATSAPDRSSSRKRRFGAAPRAGRKQTAPP